MTQASPPTPDLERIDSTRDACSCSALASSDARLAAASASAIPGSAERPPAASLPRPLAAAPVEPDAVDGAPAWVVPEGSSSEDANGRARSSVGVEEEGRASISAIQEGCEAAAGAALEAALGAVLEAGARGRAACSGSGVDATAAALGSAPAPGPRTSGSAGGRASVADDVRERGVAGSGSANPGPRIITRWDHGMAESDASASEPAAVVAAPAVVAVAVPEPCVVSPTTDRSGLEAGWGLGSEGMGVRVGAGPAYERTLRIAVGTAARRSVVKERRAPECDATLGDGPSSPADAAGAGATVDPCHALVCIGTRGARRDAGSDSEDVVRVVEDAS